MLSPIGTCARSLATMVLLTALSGVAATASAQSAVAGAAPTGDTTHAAAVEISTWHARRLTIHRVTAYTIPPLFAAQYLVGQQLYRGVATAEGPAGWVRPAHRTGAALIGTAFAINATTGLWNAWAERHEAEGRTARMLHGASMLAAAGGFTYAGVRLADQAQFSADKRRDHRAVATASMALTLISGTAMWWVNR